MVGAEMKTGENQCLPAFPTQPDARMQVPGKKILFRAFLFSKGMGKRKTVKVMVMTYNLNPKPCISFVRKDFVVSLYQQNSYVL